MVACSAASITELNPCCRRRIPEGLISGKKRAKASQYAISLDGLSEYKQDLDLISSNCKQYWSPELEATGSQDACFVTGLLESAAEFQKQVDQVFTSWHRKVTSHEATLKK